MLLIFLSTVLVLLAILIIKMEVDMGTGLTNLQEAITKLQAQQALTIAALQVGGDSDTAVQSAADAVNAVTAALATATPVAPTPTPAV